MGAIKVKRVKSFECSECGNVIKADNPPDVCPVCEALDSYFETPEVVYGEPSEHESAHGEEGEIEED